MKHILLTALVGVWVIVLCAQPAFTALQHIAPYAERPYFGTNLGYYGPTWTDAQLATIAAGSHETDVPGVGVRNLRITLPEHFLERWGYGIELPDVQHYHALGMRELTVFLQGPSEEHRLRTMFCEQQSPHLFENMYEPIWDNGANGTPVNDNNYFARYVYMTVQTYGEYVRFWEILNEPDYTPSGYGWQPPTGAGNWYDNPPNPCDLKNLRAPIYYYIRMLRIAYEVIKTLQPDTYVAVGGLGYPSFLDALLRYTDNPDGGTATAQYPHTGGAYFDVLSYHSYPANDGSLRHYDFDLHQMIHYQHSDAAAQGVIRLKDDFNTVLEARGYNDQQHPRKLWIVTESNISRASFNDQMGSPEGQRNFVVKAMVKSMQHGISQYYTFMLGDKKTAATATNAWDLMGFYYALSATPPYQQQVTPNGVAFRTAADMLHQYRYNAGLTQQLALPADVDGAAFSAPGEPPLFVLWAKTTINRSEQASATYSFPTSIPYTTFERREWEYSRNQQTQMTGRSGIPLQGSPSFFVGQISSGLNEAGSGLKGMQIRLLTNLLHPGQSLQLSTTAQHSVNVDLRIFNTLGQELVFMPRRGITAGSQTLDVNLPVLPTGTYYCVVGQPEAGQVTLPFIVR